MFEDLWGGKLLCHVGLFLCVKVAEKRVSMCGDDSLLFGQFLISDRIIFFFKFAKMVVWKEKPSGRLNNPWNGKKKNKALLLPLGFT